MMQLEKYRGKQSRITCPSCGAKNSFVRYQNENGEYIAFDVGRCNRESSCGYHKKPKEFFAENPQFSNNLRQGFNRKKRTQSVYPQRILNNSPKSQQFGKTELFELISTIEKKYLTASLGNYEKNNFVYFLHTLFGSETVQNLIDRFAIGTAKDNKTVFWQIDEKGLIRTGRIILYDKLKGKRSKDVPQNWIHSLLQKQGLLENFELNQCLFGLHQILIESEKGKTIAIVEADKSAVIATALIPDFIWMSAGAKGYLNAEKLKPLVGRKVVLFPDTDAFSDWNEKAKTLRSIIPSLKVSNYLDELLTDDQKAKGSDIADFLIEQRQHEVWQSVFYDSKVDAILADEILTQEFETVVSERIAVMMIDGGISESEAENFIFAPENIQPLVLGLAESSTKSQNIYP